MGLFYHVHSLALSEDLPGLEHEHDHEIPKEDFYAIVDRGYAQNAMNCWIAACLYLVTLFFSGHQFWLNSRSSLSI